MLRVEPRGERSRRWAYASPLIAIVLTLLSGAVIFEALGQAPLPALYAYFIEPISTEYGRTELLVKAAPLILIGIGLALGFRANVWNIGAEGQFTMGALAGGGLALAFYDQSSILLLPAMTVAGALGGLAWAAVPAWLKTRFNANEILTSLMLTYVAQLFLSYLVHGPWRSPAGFNFPETRLFHDSATLPLLLDGSRLHVGVLVAFLAAAVAWLLLARSLVGFQMRVVGLAPRAAGFAGFRQGRLVWISLLISGGLAGMAGLFEVAGPIGQIVPTISPGYGFTAIIVAFLGRLHPAGVVVAGLVLALTYLGGESAQISLGLPAAVTGIFQGVLLFFLLACDLLILYRIRLGRPAAREGAR